MYKFAANNESEDLEEENINLEKNLMVGLEKLQKNMNEEMEKKANTILDENELQKEEEMEGDEEIMNDFGIHQDDDEAFEPNLNQDHFQQEVIEEVEIQSEFNFEEITQDQDQIEINKISEEKCERNFEFEGESKEYDKPQKKDKSLSKSKRIKKKKGGFSLFKKKKEKDFERIPPSSPLSQSLNISHSVSSSKQNVSLKKESSSPKGNKHRKLSIESEEKKKITNSTQQEKFPNKSSDFNDKSDIQINISNEDGNTKMETPSQSNNTTQLSHNLSSEKASSTSSSIDLSSFISNNHNLRKNLLNDECDYNDDWEDEKASLVHQEVHKESMSPPSLPEEDDVIPIPPPNPEDIYKNIPPPPPPSCEGKFLFFLDFILFNFLIYFLKSIWTTTASS